MGTGGPRPVVNLWFLLTGLEYPKMFQFLPTNWYCSATGCSDFASGESPDRFSEHPAAVVAVQIEASESHSDCPELPGADS